MNVPINAKRLRGSLPDVVERVRKGTRFTVIYRSRPAFQIVPVNDADQAPAALSDDPLYRGARRTEGPPRPTMRRCTGDEGAVRRHGRLDRLRRRRGPGARPMLRGARCCFPDVERRL